MKKVLVSVVLVLVMVATVVSAAAGVNGQYDGYDIVKLKANGQTLAVEDVPAFVYKGRTMVPVGMLRQTGLEVTWNQDEYSVDVVVPKNEAEEKSLSVKDLVKESEQYKSTLVNILSESDFTSITFYYDDDFYSSSTFDYDFEGLLHVYGKTDFEMFKMVDINNQEISGSNYFINDYLQGRISIDELFDQIYINGVKVIDIKTNQNQSYQTPEQDYYLPIIGELHLYSYDGKTYLGELTSNEFDSDSIFNEFGDYGSEYSSYSIWNEYGDYGSKYSNKSAFNDYATEPPIIVDEDGNIIGYLTTNKYTLDGISPYGLKEWLEDNGY